MKAGHPPAKCLTALISKNALYSAPNALSDDKRLDLNYHKYHVYYNNFSKTVRTSLRLCYLFMLPKRLPIYSKFVAISVLSSCLPGMAQEKNGWHYDFLGSKSDSTEPDAHRVYEILLKMLDRWNARDFEGHLD